MPAPATVLVTGGAGFIGSALVRHLVLDTGARVVTVDKLGYGSSLLNLAPVADCARHTFVRLDIRDRRALAAVFDAHRPLAVMHLAAESHVDRSIDGPAEFIQSNIVGTYSLLECCLDHYRSLERAERERFRVLHVSTDEVYGSLSADSPPFVEDDPYRPRSPYSASKAASDHLALAWHHTYGLPVIVSNCTNNYGPYQYPEKLIPVVILRALRGESIPVYGDGRNVRDWLHVSDHVEALTAIVGRGRIGERYNVGGSSELENIELVKRLCALLDEMAPRDGAGSYAQLVRFVEDRPGHDLRYAMATAKIERELRWRARRDIDSGLRETVRWYLDNAAWCDAVTGGAPAGERIGLARST